jgi:hypothetical protein
MHSFKQRALEVAWPDRNTAESILARLEGFQGYPKTSKGREIWVDALVMALSDRHAREAIAVFDEKFPTVRQLRDAVHNLRPRFEKPINLVEQWLADGSTYDPDFIRNAAREAIAAKERKAAEWRERLLKLGKPVEPKETEADTRLKPALESLDGGYDIPESE